MTIVHALVPVLAIAANGSAWIFAIVDGDISFASVVAFSSIAIPAVVAAIVYIFQKLGPVILDFIAKLDQAKSQSLAGQMSQLNALLGNAKAEAEAKDRLAATNAQIADTSAKLAEVAKQSANRIQGMYEESEMRSIVQIQTIKTLTQSNSELVASIAEIKDSLQKARDSVHALRDEANSYQIKAELMSKQIELYKNDIVPIVDQLNVNTASIDKTETKVGQVSEFGSKIEVAAKELNK